MTEPISDETLADWLDYYGTTGQASVAVTALVAEVRRLQADNAEARWYAAALAVALRNAIDWLHKYVNEAGTSAHRSVLAEYDKWNDQ